MQIDIAGLPVFIVTAEDLLLSKLIWIQDVQSAVRMADIKSLALLETLDWNYLQHWIAEMNLNTFALLEGYG